MKTKIEVMEKKRKRGREGWIGCSVKRKAYTNVQTDTSSSFHSLQKQNKNTLNKSLTTKTKQEQKT